MALAFGAASALAAMAVTAVVGSTPQASARNAAAAANPAPATRSSLVSQGKHTFRFDTFNDQAFWGGVLHLNRAIAGKANGGVGPGVSPKTALAVGLKVDVDALPASVKQALKEGKVNLNDPATTLALLKLNAVVGVKGVFGKGGRLTSVGIECALCHSTVDNSFAPGIGHRLDGWANRDLNVGAIIALSPALTARQKAVYNSWGPGMYDPRFNQDGKNMPVVIPPAFGLRHVKREIYTGDDTVSYWNAYVAITQMHGHGHFADPRINVDVNNPPDLVTSKLRALKIYQFSLEGSPPREGLDSEAVRRGRALFHGAAGCASCHAGRIYTDVNRGVLHSAAEVGQDPAYAERSATGLYRTTPLRGLWHPPQLQGPYFHDGGATTLMQVVEHYVRLFGLSLSSQQRQDLVAYLKTL